MRTSSPSRRSTREIGIQQQLTDDICGRPDRVPARYPRPDRHAVGRDRRVRRRVQVQQVHEQRFRLRQGDRPDAETSGSAWDSRRRWTTRIQVAKGSASDPAGGPQCPRRRVAAGSAADTRCRWDQRHTLNVTAAYSADSWGVSAIGQYGSGSPYTPRELDRHHVAADQQPVEAVVLQCRSAGLLRIPLGRLPARGLRARVQPASTSGTRVTCTTIPAGRGSRPTRSRPAQTNPSEDINTLVEWYRQPALLLGTPSHRTWNEPGVLNEDTTNILGSRHPAHRPTRRVTLPDRAARAVPPVRRHERQPGADGVRQLGRHRPARPTPARAARGRTTTTATSAM